MSVKDLFKNKISTRAISAETPDSLGREAESIANVENKNKRSQIFIPPVDFSSASNFAVYGLAEKYYEDAVKRVYLQYPYDGSEAEINEYLVSSSYLDHYILEKRYPRTNGYVVLCAGGWGAQVGVTGSYGAPASASYEYISLKGGPHTNLPAESRVASAFTGSNNQNNIYSVPDKRASNLSLNPASGSTVEFWLKKSEFVTSLTEKEVVFDVWNNEATTLGTYGRLMVELSGAISSVSPFRITYASGTSGFKNHRIGLLTAADVADDIWHHYAITFVSSSTALTAKLYIDGDLNDTETTSSTVNEVTGALVASIGALRTSPTGSTYATQGWGKLSASLDEFRYWKIERTAEDVGRNFFTQVRGGTNTDDANVDLGVYYKFNEGITGISSNDSVVLDYSGRISNGSWTGYNTSARNTGSAMVSSSAALAEFEDPIIYSDHPSVTALLSELQDSGSVYDVNSNSNIYNSLPAWIQEEDSSGDLKNLVQVMASYFDRLQSQIKEVPKIKNLQYQSSSNAPAPFASNLVNSTGMTSPEIFVDANIMEMILSRDENRDYNLDIDEVKNRIYQNIYNNLVYINKSKGTEKAFRNLIHCYGIDEELIRLNTYGNNVTYELKNNFKSRAVAKNLVNFNTTENFDATIYQYADPSDSNTVSFISGTGADLLESYIGFTLEGEMIFPVPTDPCVENSFSSDFLTVSLMGMHRAEGTTPTDTTVPAADTADLRIIAVRPNLDSADAYFKLTSSISQIESITTDTYKDVFNNTKWNFAARLINTKYPLGDVITGVAGDSYQVEFYGVNMDLDIAREEFFLSSSVKANSAAIDFLHSDKRIFAGAHRTNFTGSVLQQSNVKLSNVRYWADYVSNAVIAAHARDTDNNGTLNPHRNAFLTQTSLTGTYIPEIETLALDWNFYNITGSNASGRFIVDDYSSGSTTEQARYGWYGNIVKAQHTGRGDFFGASDSNAIDRDYIYVARQSHPEIVHSSEMIRILDSDDEFFNRDQRPINYFLSIEKSMYQVISDEMINTFATILEFNNLIGDPINRYRQDYKLLEKARNLFFEKVENIPDLDKFIDFYKWIDSSLSGFLQQIMPSSAASSEGVQNLVESHILERNKYWTKYPTIERRSPTLTGSAPIPTDSGFASTAPSNQSSATTNQQYWQQRASRTEAPLATGDNTFDLSRQALFQALTGSYRRSAAYSFSAVTEQQKASPRRMIHGGINYAPSKNRNIVLNATSPQGPQAASGTPLNVMLIDNTDVIQPTNITGSGPEEKEKKFLSYKVSLRRDQELGSKTQGRDGYAGIMKGALASPFNLISSSVNTGYNKLVVENFSSGTMLTNLHADTTVASNDIPMQGPFTERHVGGHQSRHASINRYVSSRTTINKIDNKNVRGEAYQILLGTQYGTDDTFIGITEAQYPYPVGPYPEPGRKKAVYYRQEFAKRPVNIRNIKHTTASFDLGNYDKDYQIVQTTGRSLNNRYFIDNEGVQLPSLYHSGDSYTAINYLNTKQITALSGTLGAAGAPGYRISTDTSLNNPTAFSFSMWLSCSNATAQSTDRYLISIGSDNLSAFGRAMYIDTSNKMILKLGYTTTDGIWTSDATIWSSTGWNHFAMTYNNGDGDANFYINGVEAGGSFTTSPVGTFETPASDSTLLCRRNNSSGVITNNTSFYSGSAAEASYWNKKLTSVEIGEIYERGNAGDNEGPQDLTEHSAVANLVSWWRFGEDTSDTEMLINDQVNSNDAAGIALQADNGMELRDLTAADLLIAGGGTTSTVLRHPTLPATTNVNSLIGIRPQSANGGNFFGHHQTAPVETSNRFSGSTNFSVPDRGRNSDIIVNRFSAPGGPEVNSAGYLDLAASEKSVYNALPFRNLSVLGSGSGESNPTIRVMDHLDKQRGLRTLRALHAGQFGHDATYGSVTADNYITQPSYHKNNRNSLKRIGFSGIAGFDNHSYVSASVHDNDNVSYSIPRSDLQYSWITASYQTSRIVGHAWNDSIVSSSGGGFQQAISFVTSSHTGAAGISVDFANLNTLIVDPIDIANNIVSSSNSEYRNTAIGTMTPAGVLHGLLLHRNGAYGVNTWKQIRAGESALARALRKRNIISYVEGASYNYPLNVRSSSVAPRLGAISHFTESVVVSKYAPIEQELSVRALNADGTITTQDTIYDSTYANNRTGFTSNLLNNLYNVSPNSIQPYDELKALYLNGATEDPNSPVEEFISLTYKENVYPSALNMYSSSIRVRQNYQNKFWRDLRQSRTQKDLTIVKGFALTNNNLIKSQSMWSLDADEDFLTGRFTARTGTGSNAGLLQQRYNQFHSGTRANITASAQYARIHTVDRPQSVISPVGGYSASVGLELYQTAGNLPFTRAISAGATDELYGGMSLWEAGDQSGKKPWYDNYDDYISEMRLVGKDYSIIPEFRISEHIDRYVKDLGGNFLAENSVFLQLEGGTSDRDKSDEAQFYKTYTNSDFLKFFQVVRSEHSEVGTPTNIALSCKAIKKFLPYDGFYPAERTVQMSLQFSSSYAANVRLTGSDSPTSSSGSVGPNAGLRAFTTPMFGPGIMFNTIKSGLAVDYPMFSASVEVHADTSKSLTGATPFISGSGGIGRFHYRIPFEAMVEPENYLVDKDMADMEPSPSCSLMVTASWNGLGDSRYKMMASNFFAEVPDFFLPEGQFTSIVSRPENQFEQVKSGEQYAARIKMFKSLNVSTLRTGSLGYRNPMVPRDMKGEVYETFTMYSRPTAFGPPCGGGPNEPKLTAADGLNLPFTPPYYNGEAWADLIFTSPRNSTSDNPITLQEIFSPGNLSVSYRRVGNEWPAMVENVMYASGNVEYNALQLDASLNLFGQAQVKDLKYNPATGQPTEAQDSTENVWVIQPKFETPMFNFSGSEVTYPVFGSASVGVGMWHQYGTLPESPDRGVFLQIADIPENYIQKALGGTPSTTGSLVDLVGFGTDAKRLGAVAASKTVSEAVVAVPYVVTNGQREFFSIERQKIEKSLRIINFEEQPDINGQGNPGDSVINMVKSMQKYILPPRMDFLQNSDSVEPFSMYIFEFHHTFDQDDLVDIWQNLPPKIAYSFDIDRNDYPPTSQVISEVEIEHPLLADELLSGNLEDRLQWMVFKVKQKAKKNYFDKVIKDSRTQVGNFDRTLGVQVGREDSSRVFDPKYSYNWPYDFFSLVELVKLDAEVDIEPRED